MFQTIAYSGDKQILFTCLHHHPTSLCWVSYLTIIIIISICIIFVPSFLIITLMLSTCQQSCKWPKITDITNMDS